MKYQWFHRWDYIECPDAHYDLTIEELRSKGLSGWLQHLRQKRWFDKESEESFIVNHNELLQTYRDVKPILRAK